MSVTFKATTTRTEVNKWYKVEGAPVLKSGGRQLLPSTVQITFADGEPKGVIVNAHLVMKSGQISDKSQKVSGIYVWDQPSWPEWLKEVFQQAVQDLAADRQVVSI